MPIIVRLILRGSNNKKTKYSKQVATNSSKTLQKDINKDVIIDRSFPFSTLLANS